MATNARKKLTGDLLHNGDHVNQTDFHTAYESMPDNYRAELIGGIVYEPSPLGLQHGEFDVRLGHLLDHYAGHTTGVQVAGNATVILGDEDEVQPDLVLRISPQFGGQSKDTKKIKKNPFYVLGAPELVAEIAHSSRAIDLHLKKERYKRAGVLEYIVVCLEPKSVHWFDLRNDSNLIPVEGIFRSNVFPGLWIDGDALLELDYKGSIRALNLGIETSSYKDFAARLAKA